MLTSSCENSWRGLNRTDLSPIPPNSNAEPSEPTFSAILQYFTANSQIKIISLRALTPADNLYLARQKISPKYLIANLKKTMTGCHLDANAFQLEAVRRKTVYALCPFTGTRLQSSHSLLANINVMFYRFHSEDVFYLVTAGVGYGFKKSALYFPNGDLLVTTGDQWGVEPDDVVELKARMVFSSAHCYNYLADNRNDKTLAVCVGYYHFAHHLWNELSGLHRLYSSGLLKYVDKCLILREPLGNIGDIFPEIPKGRIERLRSTHDLFDHILTNNYFAVRVGDYFIPSDLVRRVYAVAVRNCPLEMLATVKEANGRCSKLLWVGIRVGSRSWDNQVDGLFHLIDRLHTKFPTLGIVFDGFSTPADRCGRSGKEDHPKIVDQEMQVVSGILERLRSRHKSLRVYNIVGESIYVANIWAHAADLYVSPYGSLQHKVGWLANKPGIIHTNQFLLEHRSKYIWAIVESTIRPRYITSTGVTDSVPLEQSLAYNELSDASESGAGVHAANRRMRGAPEFNNYTVDWNVLYADLVTLMRTPTFCLRVTPSLLAATVKRRIWWTLQWLTRNFDSAKL